MQKDTWKACHLQICEWERLTTWQWTDWQKEAEDIVPRMRQTTHLESDHRSVTAHFCSSHAFRKKGGRNNEDRNTNRHNNTRYKRQSESMETREDPESTAKEKEEIPERQQHTATAAAHRESTVDSKDQELWAPIEKSKNMDRRRRPKWKTSAKRSRKGIRDNKRSKIHEKVQKNHEEFTGIKSIANIKTRETNIHITHMRNEAGDIEASRKRIANTFAKFYEDLSWSRSGKRKDDKDNAGRLEDICDHADDDENIEDDERDNHIPEFTMKQLIIAIDSLNKEISKELTNKRQQWYMRFSTWSSSKTPWLPVHGQKLWSRWSTRKETRRNQKTTDQSAPSQCFRNFSPL